MDFKKKIRFHLWMKLFFLKSTGSVIRLQPQLYGSPSGFDTMSENL